MADNHDNFFQEVEEDVRLERLEKLWKKYQNHLIGGVTAFVIIMGGGLYWNHWQEEKKETLSQKYSEALVKLQEGNKHLSMALLDDLKNEKGYGSLAMLMKASFLGREKKTLPEALKIYEEISKNSSYEKKIRTLASLTKAYVEVDSGDPSILRKELESLSNPDNPWQAMAVELQAALEHKSGNLEKAKELYQQLADDAGASQSMRVRALALLSEYNLTDSKK